MADYTIHLGYNLQSPTIGAVWAEADAPLGSALADKGYQFLQYALGSGQGVGTDGTAPPAWFTSFQDGDNLYVQLWDLSTAANAIPSSWTPKLSLSALAAATTYDPSVYLTYSSSTAVRSSERVNDVQNDYLELLSISFEWKPSSGFLGPWGLCRGQSQLMGPLTWRLPDGTTPLQCKLSFYLETVISNNGDRIPDVFLGDPEVIVGSMG
ncbi:MAG TPA: hypothetical protein VNO30_48945 [Kofleriaceae bacterium]|nr:hypothetical protein [Kofleriaceae bacterium]